MSGVCVDCELGASCGAVPGSGGRILAIHVLIGMQKTVLILHFAQSHHNTKVPHLLRVGYFCMD